MTADVIRFPSIRRGAVARIDDGGEPRPAPTDASAYETPPVPAAGGAREAAGSRQRLGLRGVLALWCRRRRERATLARELPAMPDEMLADLGLTRCEARAESRKPFWRA
ncbi:DUF1127 domain-containing protein [Methylobacterium sp. JK268]